MTAMNENHKPQYLYLNRDGRWTGFGMQGLTLSDGALELTPLPQLQGIIPQSIQSAGAPAGASGVAVASDGTVYFSDLVNRRISRIRGCDGTVCPLPCLGQNGKAGRLNTPRGLVVMRNRPALFAVDSGNHRVQVFDPDTGQLLSVLGQAGPNAPANPGSAPGRLNTPWGLAGDSACSLYVLDYGNARVQKWNRVGDPVPSFWDNVNASKLLTQPLDVCAADVDGSIWVFILESSTPQVFVFDSDGNRVNGPDGSALSIGKGKLQAPLGMAASANALLVGDNAARRIFEFSLADCGFVGEARGYEGPVAALCLDSSGSLWVDAGTSDPPLQLSKTAAFAAKGFLWVKSPIRLDHPQVEWQRLQAEIQALSPNAHLDFLVFTSNFITDAPKIFSGTDNPLSDPKWRQAPHPPGTDLDDIYIGGCPATYLWVAAQFSGDGSASPVLTQVRVQFDRDSYLNYLPAIYRNQAACGDFLLRFLSLFESMYQDVEGEIRGLPALFDAKATPAEFLAWLADWLGLELDESWSERKQRKILSEIFRLYALRGTAAGLRRSLKLFAGIDAVIEEPILNAAWWSLPSTATACCDSCAGAAGATPTWQDTQNSILGFTSMLAPAQPQGAVVGTSAVLDQSHLTTVDEFGIPLFSDVAYQFSVQVYRGQIMCADVLPRVRALLDQEKPAHTTYRICVVEPEMRAGYQCRVGIDTVVGGPSRSLSLGSEQVLGEDTILAGPLPSRLEQSRLGLSTRVG